ncbi:MAG: hypothetical protein RLN86_02265 [Cyclobacteriaceae bacterium]
MSQFDLIEKYVTNNLNEAERLSFEQEMKGDAQLRSEVKLQQDIIEGVKQARVAELKAMLNNVPISGGYSLATGKIALATLTAGIIGAALYFTMRTESVEPQELSEDIKVEQSVPAEITEIAPVEEPTTESGVTNTESEAKSNIPAPAKKKSTPKERPAPSVSVMDPTEELTSKTEEAIANEVNTRSEISASSIEVETQSGNKDYPFHYQYAKGKLHLFGPFDAGLYEIIEINGGSHTIFLYYKEAYYHLDQRESKIVPLIQIRDTELLNRLDQYRDNPK